LQMRGVKYLRKGRVEMEDLKKEIRESARPKKVTQPAEKEK